MNVTVAFKFPVDTDDDNVLIEEKDDTDNVNLSSRRIDVPDDIKTKTQISVRSVKKLRGNIQI